MSRDQSLRSALIPLLSNSKLGLSQTALVAEVVASDARFNAWLAVDGKRTLGREEMLETIDAYDAARLHCIAAVARFDATPDLMALEAALRPVLDTVNTRRRR